MKFKCFVNDKEYYTEKLIPTDDGFEFDVDGEKIIVDDKHVCKATELKDANDNIVYDNDMISVMNNTMIVKYYKGLITLDSVEVYVDGLVFMDFEFKPYLIGADIINNPSMIQVVGNIIPNNITPLGDE